MPLKLTVLVFCLKICIILEHRLGFIALELLSVFSCLFSKHFKAIVQIKCIPRAVYLYVIPERVAFF